MQCPECRANNSIGATYCARCGARIIVTDTIAHFEAVESNILDRWERVFKAMNRGLFLLFVALIGSLIFYNLVTGPFRGDFMATAPIPPLPSVTMTDAFIKPPAISGPDIKSAPFVQAEKGSEAEIIKGFVAEGTPIMVTLRLKNQSVVSGMFLSRSASEVRVITQWGPPHRIVTVRVSDIEVSRPQLPE